MDLGFKNKLLLTVTLIIVVCLCTSSILFYQQEKKAITDTLYIAAKERVRNESSKIGKYLTVKTNLVSKIADDYIEYQYDNNHDQRMRIAALGGDLASVMVGFKDGSAYTSYDYPGWINYQNPSSYDPRKRPWYIKGMKEPNELIITDPYTDAMTHEKIISIVKNIGNGVLVADIPLQTLDDIVNGINMEGFAAAIIMEDDSVLVTNSDVLTLGGKLTDHDSLIQMSHAIRKAHSTVVDYEINGSEKVLFSEKIPYQGRDWYLIVGMHKSVILNKLDVIKQQTIMLVFIYIILSILITLMTLNVLYRPILALKRTVLGLSEGSGDISQRLRVTSADDLGQIAHGVNLFVDKIQMLLGQESSDKSSKRWKDAFEQYQDRMDKEEEFQEELKLDALTRLPTRSYFEILLADSIKDIYINRVDLLLLTINIKNYELVAESFTYNQLQRATLQLAELIENLLPQGTVLARTAQDEFSIIYNLDNNDQEFKPIVSELAQELKLVQTESLAFRCKIGASHLSYTDDRPTVSGLLYQVNNALFTINDYSDSNYAFFHKKQDAEKELKQALIAEFKSAMEASELELYFQPQVNIAKRLVCGAESLIRWHHPQRGCLTPDRFIHVLDDAQLNIQFGEWLIESALDILSQRDDDLTISINIMPDHLQNENFYERLKHILRRYPENLAQRLKLELTETSDISDHSRVQRSMSKCSALGVVFSLDDFGTGYSTLNQLRTLPATELKIDRSFIQNIEQRQDDQKMVKTILMLAYSFNIKVVVEGVESIEQERLLKSYGCAIIQGYKYSKPLPYTEFNQWLENFNADMCSK